MASLKERLDVRITRLRAQRPIFDHVVRMVQHFGEVKGNLQAGAVTYFGFLSFFPILALAFFVIGWVAKVYPDAQDNLTEAIGEVLPGMLGDGKGQISLESIQDSAGAVGMIGLVGVLYAGLGWLSGMREALLVMFETPQREQPNFVVGKVRDLVSLGLIGLVMMVSVAVSGIISRFSEQLLDLLGLGVGLSPLLLVISVAVGVGASAVLFFALFKLLADPDVPRASLWSGALLGALGFEILKQLSTFLIASTKSQPAFQAFGIALILVVWINYFSRVVMYAAAWAYTSRRARASRSGMQQGHVAKVVAAPDVPGGPSGGAGGPVGQFVGAGADRRGVGGRGVGGRGAGGSAPGARDGRGVSPKAAFAAGGAAMLAVIAAVRRRPKG
ncbi:YihY/virulence factor BrkB family protein [Nocardioides sp. JQ2195]|uniref:YihY/virulence factor BrkB family protein n=1 Tax=Nocardioides sp. JQ2195 TaxID=2592334 RepID=UPI00143EA6B0|nr:YihY/virulence factor BrkB family protein [Nocardioides sp. JQ2195]QIX25867.1 YihY/virulence factor BrkB family protein [Nocardioides sp. JQ2195]